MTKSLRFSLLNVLLALGFACSTIAVVVSSARCSREVEQLNILHRHYFGQRSKIDLALHLQLSEYFAKNPSTPLTKFFRHQALWTLIESWVLSERWDTVIGNDDQRTLAEDALRYLGNPTISELRKHLAVEFDSGDKEQNIGLYPEIYDFNSEAYNSFTNYLASLDGLNRP